MNSRIKKHKDGKINKLKKTKKHIKQSKVSAMLIKSLGGQIAIL